MNSTIIATVDLFLERCERAMALNELLDKCPKEVLLFFTVGEGAEDEERQARFERIAAYGSRKEIEEIIRLSEENCDNGCTCPGCNERRRLRGQAAKTPKPANVWTNGRLYSSVKGTYPIEIITLEPVSFELNLN